MTEERVTRIAMWSGPRNLSTAMMRSFGNRADCAVWDEPFYAAYLERTGIDHPMRDAVIATGETAPDKIVAACLGAVPAGRPIYYQKHMTHHMAPEFDRSWIAQVSNAFLIRAPERVAASYSVKREIADLRDIGFVEQKELFDQVADQQGAAPPVVDAADIRRAPEATLTELCAALGIPFDKAMLTWPAGPHPSEGVWAAHWYDAVRRSTAFAAPEGEAPTLDDHAKRLADAARPYYEALRPYAIGASV